MAFRYDVDISSNETGTASYSADDFVALDQTPDALNPVDHPNRYLSYGFSNAFRARLHRLAGTGRISWR